MKVLTDFLKDLLGHFNFGNIFNRKFDWAFDFAFWEKQI